MHKNHDDFDENEYFYEQHHVTEDDDIEFDPEYAAIEPSGIASIPKELRDVVSNRGKYYLTNAELLPAVLEAKAKGKITDKLAKMLMLLADRYSRKSNFVGYTYRDDMVSEALLNLANTALCFDEKRSSNPFAYYTKAITHSFLQYMAKEKKEHYIRDTMLIGQGHEPSTNYSENFITKKVSAANKKKDDKKQNQQLISEILGETPKTSKNKNKKESS